MSDSTRIFFVGLGLLQDVVERMLSDQPQVDVVGSAQSWEAAKTQIAASKPNVVIMARSSKELNEADLAEIPHSIKIIYLTPDENRIIVHDRQQIRDAALSDLIGALKFGDRQE